MAGMAKNSDAPTVKKPHDVMGDTVWRCVEGTIEQLPSRSTIVQRRTAEHLNPGPESAFRTTKCTASHWDEYSLQW